MELDAPSNEAFDDIFDKLDTPTQEKIEELSSELGSRYAAADSVAGAWLDYMQRAPLARRLALMYLASHMMQHPRTIVKDSFANAFGDVLPRPELLDCLRGLPAVEWQKLQRLVQVWRTRHVLPAVVQDEVQGWFVSDGAASAGAAVAVDDGDGGDAEDEVDFSLPSDTDMALQIGAGTTNHPVLRALEAVDRIDSRTSAAEAQQLRGLRAELVAGTQDPAAEGADPCAVLEEAQAAERALEKQRRLLRSGLAAREQLLAALAVGQEELGQDIARIDAQLEEGERIGSTLEALERAQATPRWRRLEGRHQARKEEQRRREAEQRELERQTEEQRREEQQAAKRARRSSATEQQSSEKYEKKEMVWDKALMQYVEVGEAESWRDH